MSTRQIVNAIQQLTNSIRCQNKLIRQCLGKLCEKQQTIELRIILKILFPNPPPIIDPDSINRLTDKSLLLKLESKYDEFIEKNQEALCLHELIEDLLDIRDCILLRLGRVVRLEKTSDICI